MIFNENDIDFDKPLPIYVFEACWNCGAILRTKDKARLSLFMLDHWGMDDIRRCKANVWGKLVKKFYMWKYRNV
jgi:hypothetical protein